MFNTLVQFPSELVHAFRRARHAVRDEGLSVPRQLLDLVRLRRGPGKLRPDDYYLMSLYRRDLSFAEKSVYLSNPAMGALRRDRRWGLVADDKLLTYGLLRGNGVSTPEMLALVHPTRSFAHCTVLRSAADLEAYLRERRPFPFFAKPLSGSYSKGGMLVRSLDEGDGALLLGDGSRLPVKDFARQVCERSCGYLIQELLEPHPEIAALVGDRLCTVRMIVLFDNDGPRLNCALWKIAAGTNMADNYWREGNILALLDNERGTVRRCTMGLGERLREVDCHPETNKRLIGFQLPAWDGLLDLTLSAARTLPGLPVQAWDIAPTARGPIALEVNVFGSLFLPQVATRAGLYQGEFRAFMEAHRR